MDELSQIDLAFCVDLTSSMGPFIQAARQHAMRILDGLRATEKADLRVAVVGYRDHGPPGSQTDPVELHPFMTEAWDVRQVLDGLSVGSGAGNTDAAEAVFAGLDACLRRLEWRPRCYRIVVLVGDGPPHACGANGEPWPDRFPERDPTGHTLHGLANQAEGGGLFLHAMGMVPSSIPLHDRVLEESFQRLAQSTGGAYHRARDARAAMSVLEAIAKRVFGELSLDREVWAQLAPSGAEDLASGAPLPVPAPQAVAVPGASPEQVSASVQRLQKRGLVQK